MEFLICKFGILNVVFNFEFLISIDNYCINKILELDNIIKLRKGVSLFCGISTNSILNNENKIKKIKNELYAIKVINWNN